MLNYYVIAVLSVFSYVFFRKPSIHLPLKFTILMITLANCQFHMQSAITWRQNKADYFFCNYFWIKSKNEFGGLLACMNHLLPGFYINWYLSTCSCRYVKISRNLTSMSKIWTFNGTFILITSVDVHVYSAHMILRFYYNCTFLTCMFLLLCSMYTYIIFMNIMCIEK